jgi:G3E family GTPase
MKSLSLCITCCDLDILLLYKLFYHLKKQTELPDEIIISCSGVSESEFELLKNNLNPIMENIPIVYTNSIIRHNQAKARNIGANVSNCEIIMFFDVDDIPHPDKIKITKKVLNDFDLDAIAHNYHTGNEEFLNIKEYNTYISLKKSNQNTNIIVCDNPDLPVHHSHILCKKSIFEKISFNESQEFYRREDGKFCQDILDAGFKFGYVDAKLVLYT